MSNNVFTNLNIPFCDTLVPFWAQKAVRRPKKHVDTSPYPETCHRLVNIWLRRALVFSPFALRRPRFQTSGKFKNFRGDIFWGRVVWTRFDHSSGSFRFSGEVPFNMDYVVGITKRNCSLLLSLKLFLLNYVKRTNTDVECSVYMAVFKEIRLYRFHNEYFSYLLDLRSCFCACVRCNELSFKECIGWLTTCARRISLCEIYRKCILYCRRARLVRHIY